MATEPVPPNDGEDGSAMYGCGYEWDHTIQRLGEGHWECTECGAEGCDEEIREAGGSQ